MANKRRSYKTCPHLIDGECRGRKEDSEKYYVCESCPFKEEY